MAARPQSQDSVYKGSGEALTAVLTRLSTEKAEMVCPYDGQVLGEYAGEGSIFIRICRRCKTYWAYDTSGGVYYQLERDPVVQAGHSVMVK